MYASEPITLSIKSYKDRIPFVFAGDLHWASEESAHKLWWNMFKEYPDGRYILTGDALHMINPTDKRWAGTHLREEYLKYDVLSKVCQAEVENLAGAMVDRLGRDWIKAHILGALSGNHPYTKKKYYGFDPHDMFCEHLGVPNWGYSAMVPVRLHCATTRTPFMVMVHHGFGGACRTEGGDVTKFCRHAMQYRADVCIYGHTHECWAKKIVQVDWMEASGGNAPWIKEDLIKVVGQSGTFKRTLSRGRDPSWEETRGFPIRHLGWLVVYASIGRIREEGRDQRYVQLDVQT